MQFPICSVLIVAAAWWIPLAAQSRPLPGSGADRLTSPVAQQPTAAATNVIVNAAPNAGDAPLGITINEGADEILVVDLFGGTTWLYDRSLATIGSIPNPGGLNTTTGIAWASNTDTLFWIDVTAGLLYETDGAGAFLASSPIASPGAGLLAGLAYRAATDTLVADDIVTDSYHEFDRGGLATGFSFANPDDQPPGTGAFGNGISHDDGDGFHIATGTMSEGQVMRMYDLDSLGAIEGVLWEMTDPALGSFDSFVNGHAYTPTGSLTRPAEYIVGNATNTIFEMDAVVCALGPISGLGCAAAGSDIELTWTNGDTYTEIRVYRNGALASTLPGSATSFTDVAPPTGQHVYRLVAESGANCADGESCSVLAGAFTDLIFDGDSGSTDSTAAVESALTALGRSPIVLTSLPADLSGYESVWMMCGIFPSNHVLTVAEGDALVTFVTGTGGLVYVEGGDVWGYDPPTAWDTLDGVLGLSDGSGDLFNLTGGDSGAGFDLTGLNAPYSGENNWIDHLAPDLPGAGVIWTNPANADEIGIFYDGGSHIALSCSFEFGGYDGDQNALMTQYVSLLGGGPPPAGDPFVRGDVNADGLMNVADAVFLLTALFVPGGTAPTCADTADVNDDGGLNVADAVSLLSALFVPNSPPPPAPHPDCGEDPTDDGLDCVDYVPCP